jgi:hypothetical protein
MMTPTMLGSSVAGDLQTRKIQRLGKRTKTLIVKKLQERKDNSISSLTNILTVFFHISYFKL